MSRSKGSHTILIFSLGLLGCCVDAAGADDGVRIRETVETLLRSRTPVMNATGPVRQRYIFTRVKKPRAILLLFAGGSGRLHLSESLLETTSTNFLLRSRRLFASAGGGFAVAVPDAASDILMLDTGLRGLRLDQAHLGDSARLIEDVRRKVAGGTRLPVCLIGTSRGAISAAAYAAGQNLGPRVPRIDCLVLTAPVTQRSKPPNESLADVALGHVTVPTLLVAHWHDTCRVSPPRGTMNLETALTGASRVDKRLFIGGLPPLSRACRPLSPHGFFGIEPWVVNVIANWIVDTLR